MAEYVAPKLVVLGDVAQLTKRVRDPTRTIPRHKCQERLQTTLCEEIRR